MEPITILGAGLAGLSLAVALREHGVSRPLVLIDRRTAWERDRTWCTWLTDTDPARPLRFAELADHRWHAWATRSRGRTVVARSAAHPYIHLDARDVYEAALARLWDAGQIEIRTGERVLAVDAEPGRQPQVSTTRETFAAELVIDAMGPGSPLARARPPAPVALSQRFLGWEVQTERPAFPEPDTATLMDFRASDGDGCCFFYVLPRSGTRALVEHTSIGAGGPAPGIRRLALGAELEVRGAGAWEILHEERGLIAMTTAAEITRPAPGVWAVGAAAGAVRPSSGYAFTRIQRHVDALARAIAARRPPPGRIGSARMARMDAIFLRALAGAADGGETLLSDVAFALDGDAFARFMTDRARPGDEARVLRALPAATMARAALANR